MIQVRLLPKSRIGRAIVLVILGSDPTIVIDWIFAPNSLQFLDYPVHPKQLSDHRLIHAKLRLK